MEGLNNGLKITPSLYSYLLASPVTVLFIYFLAYASAAYTLYRMGSMLPNMCKEVPYQHFREKYGKGRYKHTLREDRRKKTRDRHKQRRPGPKPQEQRKRYSHRQIKGTRHQRWASTHKWHPILEPSFSRYFYLNCNQYSRYLDTVLNKIEPFHDDSKYESGMTCLDEDIYLPRGL